METMLAILAGLGILGIVAMGIVSMILAHKERGRLQEMIKAKDLVEYVAMTDKEEEEVEEVSKEVDITDIPFLNEEVT